MLSCMASKWWNYIVHITNGDAQTEIAARAKIQQSSLSRWKGGDPVRADQAIKVARAYGRPPIEALIAAGFLYRDEVDIPIHVQTNPALGDIDTAALFRELGRRIGLGETIAAGDGDSADSFKAKGATIHALGLNGTPPEPWEAPRAARRQEHPSQTGDDA